MQKAFTAKIYNYIDFDQKFEVGQMSQIGNVVAGVHLLMNKDAF